MINKNEPPKINPETLKLVLSKIFGVNIIHADYRIERLEGGSADEVKLVSGNAETADGEKLAFKVICKTLEKRRKNGEYESWCKEYDLYMSQFHSLFSTSLRWAECYHTEFNGEDIDLWLEYIDGVTGDDLTIEMLEQAAEEWGRLQGRIYNEKPKLLDNIKCFTGIGNFKENYFLSSKDKQEYSSYIRSDDCSIPEHLRQMIIDIDNNAGKIFDELDRLPIVISHLDFWIGNIFFSDGKIIIIDWSYAGKGIIGEDIVQLITDNTDAEKWAEYYQRLVPAYLKGISEFINISFDSLYIWEMIILKLGYDLVRWYAVEPERKNDAIDSLQKIYEIKNI